MMRTDKDILEMILNRAENDELIRGVVMNGSRAGLTATIDQYSDFDIVYYVTDVKAFTQDKSWISCFGDILIVQYSEDWYSHPYDYNSQDKFMYLIQFKDGHRIDLCICHINNINDNNEPAIVLMNKDNNPNIRDIRDEKAYFIQPPSKMAYDNTCNEFRWLSIYISKGLCRKEIYYAKYAYDVLNMKMFIKMLNWKIGIDTSFQVTTGSHAKYLKRFLSKEEMIRFHGIFPNGTYEDIWDKLFLMYDYFHELEKIVGDHFGYAYDVNETVEVRKYLLEKKKTC